MRQGQHHTPETRANMRIAQRAHPPMLGRRHSERSIRKMRKAAYRLWASPEYRLHQDIARRAPARTQ